MIENSQPAGAEIEQEQAAGFSDHLLIHISFDN
jgi:hypothetical protein